jgi:hypothetical protein
MQKRALETDSVIDFASFPWFHFMYTDVTRLQLHIPRNEAVMFHVKQWISRPTF